MTARQPEALPGAPTAADLLECANRTPPITYMQLLRERASHRRSAVLDRGAARETPAIERILPAQYVDPHPALATVPKASADPRSWEERRMNKTERAYRDQVLEPMTRSGAIARYDYEPERMRLADGAWYKPDFRIMLADGRLIFDEVKGFWREAARVRIKVAAEQHPYQFRAVRKQKAKQGGGWDYEYFNWSSDAT